MPCVQIIAVIHDATLTPFFSASNKMPSLVSIHAELTGVTGVFEMRPVLEGSGRDADPCQRQLLGPFVLAKKDCSSAHRREGESPACFLPDFSFVPKQGYQKACAGWKIATIETGGLYGSVRYSANVYRQNLLEVVCLRLIVQARSR